ncbi:replication protein A 32 kDa subunit-A isoform X3 [Nothobranchius furzeri]|uniref:replication protein A 32 kDa subunit-A isoform X3 n=1 Tax=Nothobranchius furzeri TaxID=105023 RepID=UPI002403F2E2|nr:replication protein A 32 kDa subunit-A-like isoform X3 [Nothobranchius furzeri]
MYSQGQPRVRPKSRGSDESKKSHLEILPCTVSQLLSASQVTSDCFAIRDRELHQVSVVGIVRGIVPDLSNVQLFVDDVTGPPLNVKLWINMEDRSLMSSAPPGTYVKVIGSLRNSDGQRSLLAMSVRCIKDLNEITSHMLEVVQVHMQLFGKDFDMNMNTTAFLQPYGSNKPMGLSTIQSQDTLEGLCLSTGRGMPWDSPRRAGPISWGEGSLGVCLSCYPHDPTPDEWLKMDGWMENV